MDPQNKKMSKEQRNMHKGIVVSGFILLILNLWRLGLI